MSKKKKEIEKAVEHPLEEVLEIESGTTMMPTIEFEKTEMATIPTYDVVDSEINDQFQEIYDIALDAYEQQANDLQSIEPKYRARNQEVAVQYLNAALNAAKEKLSIKQAKDKNMTSAKSMNPQTLNQNVIVADRNEVLKEIFGRGDE